jgi:hypothetical protein
VFSDSSGSLSLVARQGGQVPGAPQGVVFGGMGSVALDDLGRTTFVSRLSGPGIGSSLHQAIFRDSIDGLSLLYETGDAAPGTGGNTQFKEFIAHPSVNSRGQLAFIAILEGEGIDESNRYGIFAESAFGDLHLIVRAGDLLNVSDDPLKPDYRTIRDVDFERYPSNELGRTSGFNNLGQLVFVATFTDGTSGVFVSNAVAVPEPLTGVVVSAALTIAGFSPRQRRRGSDW